MENLNENSTNIEASEKLLGEISQLTEEFLKNHAGPNAVIVASNGRIDFVDVGLPSVKESLSMAINHLEMEDQVG